jgi:hypothetical protein
MLAYFHCCGGCIQVHVFSILYATPLEKARWNVYNLAAQVFPDTFAEPVNARATGNTTIQEVEYSAVPVSQ